MSKRKTVSRTSAMLLGHHLASDPPDGVDLTDAESLAPALRNFSKAEVHALRDWLFGVGPPVEDRLFRKVLRLLDATERVSG